MAAPVATRLLTAEEFYKLPDPPEGGKMELICGEVVTHMAVGGPHGTYVMNIGTEFELFNRQHQLGDIGAEVGFRLAVDPDIVRAPDVHFVRRDRLPDGENMPPAFFPGYPDLAVEVASPDDTDAEITLKVLQYLSAGTPRVWVVRPLVATVTVHRPDYSARTYRRGETLDSDAAGFAVDGFELQLDVLFRRER